MLHQILEESSSECIISLPGKGEQKDDIVSQITLQDQATKEKPEVEGEAEGRNFEQRTKNFRLEDMEEDHYALPFRDENRSNEMILEGLEPVETGNQDWISSVFQMLDKIEGQAQKNEVEFTSIRHGIAQGFQGVKLHLNGVDKKVTDAVNRIERKSRKELDAMKEVVRISSGGVEKELIKVFDSLKKRIDECDITVREMRIEIKDLKDKNERKKYSCGCF